MQQNPRRVLAFAALIASAGRPATRYLPATAAIGRKALEQNATAAVIGMSYLTPQKR